MVFGGEGGIVAENSLSHDPIAASRLSCKKKISTAFSSLSMADLEFDDAFWVNHIPDLRKARPMTRIHLVFSLICFLKVSVLQLLTFYVWSLKSSRTWSLCNDFKGLMTIVTFLCPPSTANPSNTRLFPYPVPAKKMLSYPCLTRWMTWICHSSGVNDSLSILFNSSRSSSMDLLGRLIPGFRFRLGVLWRLGVPFDRARSIRGRGRCLWSSWVHGTGETGVIWGRARQLHLRLFDVYHSPLRKIQ